MGSATPLHVLPDRGPDPGRIVSHFGIFDRLGTLF